ncbi:hypothetical protein [Capsulimonas corticalis]|uniref:phage adaptor protein n=1 Tax=Capsulimonas corticalis TaxID=2219043 RepID=UPI000F6468FB|nr:hypothetical protein [Capsulimonas corticalis]
MANTLADLQRDVLSRLGEAANSPAGNLESGTGAAAVLVTSATITQYLNDGASDLARTAFPIVNAGTFSWPSGAQSVQLSIFTAPGGAALWLARGVAWGGTALTHCSRSALENYYPTWAADAPGTPLYWYDTGQDGVGLYPIPNASQTVTVNGFALPPALVNADDAPSWLSPDLSSLLVFHAASMIAQKNLEDPSLAARAEVWRGEYERGKASLLARLTAADPMLARGLAVAVEQG